MIKRCFLSVAVLGVMGIALAGYAYWKVAAAIDRQLRVLSPQMVVAYDHLTINPLRREIALSEVRIAPEGSADVLLIETIAISGWPLMQLFGRNGLLGGLTLEVKQASLSTEGDIFRHFEERFPGFACSQQGAWQRFNPAVEDNWEMNAVVQLEPTDMYGEFVLGWELTTEGISTVVGSAEITLPSEELRELGLTTTPQIRAAEWTWQVDVTHHTQWIDRCANRYGKEKDSFLEALANERPHWVIGNLRITPENMDVFAQWLREPQTLYFKAGRLKVGQWIEIIGMAGQRALLDVIPLTVSTAKGVIDLKALASFDALQAADLRPEELSSEEKSTVMVTDTSPSQPAPEMVETESQVEARVVSQVETRVESHVETQVEARVTQQARTRYVYKQYQANQLSEHIGSQSRIYVRGRQKPYEGVINRVDQSSVELMQTFAKGDYSIRFKTPEIFRAEVLMAEKYMMH